MREILFRGKRTDNGEWVFGDLVHFPDRTKIDTHKNGQPWRGYDVDPDTVGQFTGLTDKNGKRIFEGDIVRVTYAVNGRKKVLLTGDVKFEDGAFFQYVYSNRRKTKGLLANFANAVHTEDEGTFCEVIGNIHDNPELLEVEE